MRHEDTPCLPDDMHALTLRMESAGNDSDKAWIRWVDTARSLIALILPTVKTLDGNQETDGYSLDFAFEAYREGKSAQEYAKLVLFDLGYDIRPRGFPKDPPTTL